MKKVLTVIAFFISATMAVPALASNMAFLECVISQGRDGGRMVRIPVDTTYDPAVPSTFLTTYEIGETPLYKFSAEVNNLESKVEVQITVKHAKGFGATIQGSDKILYFPEFGNINSISSIFCNLKPM